MRSIYLFVFMVMFLVFTACDNKVTDDSTDKEDQVETSNNVYDAMDNNTGDHEDSDDYTWDSTSETKITLNETSINVNGKGANVDGNTVIITSAGNFRITGKLVDGQIVVDAGDDDLVRLILNNVNISCSSSAPIYIKNADKTIIILPDNTQNYITDGSTYAFENSDTDEPNAAIFSNDDLSIFGEGSLTIDANFNDGLTSDDGLIIKSGIINITAADDGIRGKDCLIIRGGNITVNAGGDGLKSDNTEDNTRGYIFIENGDINIISKADGIEAETDALFNNGTLTVKTGGGSSASVSINASAKGIKGNTSVIIDEGTLSFNSADDAVHSNSDIVISGGTLNIATGDDGIHADNSVTINDGTIHISKSVEGIEGKKITINDGEIKIVASDDCTNSTAGHRTESDDKSCTYIYGGYIVLNSNRGDGLDSNGSIVMEDGTVIIHGPTNDPEVMFDYNGTFKISGGLLLGSGSASHMTQAPSSSSSQNSLKIMFNSSKSASTIFHIEDADGNNILTFQPLHRYQSIGFSSSKLVKGKTYTIYVGGSCDGEDEDGLYTGGTYSSGTQSGTFIVSNTITSLRL